eukprot:2842810-Pleurochrysis_carterae.AAC.6
MERRLRADLTAVRFLRLLERVRATVSTDKADKKSSSCMAQSSACARVNAWVHASAWACACAYACLCWREQGPRKHTDARASAYAGARARVRACSCGRASAVRASARLRVSNERNNATVGHVCNEWQGDVDAADKVVQAPTPSDTRDASSK